MPPARSNSVERVVLCMSSASRDKSYCINRRPQMSLEVAATPSMNIQLSEHLVNCKITQTSHKSVHFEFHIINHNTGGGVVLFKCSETEGLRTGPAGVACETPSHWSTGQPFRGSPLAGHALHDQSAAAAAEHAADSYSQI
ncbi:hypothetical protein J6590_023829 [Homalodisca vitripennis]|nr:hypothetical protein J6590_023829 [Homalodisca vitripennis]